MIGLAIAAGLLALALIVFALVGRDVVARILAHERERLRSHDGDAVEKRLTKIEAEQRVQEGRLQKIEIGRLGR